MKSLVVTVTLLMTVLPASAGVIYEVESTYGDTATKAGIAVEGLNMKMDVASGDQDWNGNMLFHGEDREMIVVDHDKKSYFVIDEEQMRKLAGTVN